MKLSELKTSDLTLNMKLTSPYVDEFTAQETVEVLAIHDSGTDGIYIFIGSRFHPIAEVGDYIVQNPPLKLFLVEIDWTNLEDNESGHSQRVIWAVSIESAESLALEKLGKATIENITTTEIIKEEGVCDDL